MALGNETRPAARVGHAVGRRHLPHRAAWNARAACRGSRCTRPSARGAEHERAGRLGQPRHRHPLVEGPARRQAGGARGWPNAACNARGADTSTVDLLPPPGVTRLEPGDFVEATIEHVIMPQFAADYYGPNEALRAALGQWENTWRMIHREAVGQRPARRDEDRHAGEPVSRRARPRRRTTAPSSRSPAGSATCRSPSPASRRRAATRCMLDGQPRGPERPRQRLLADRLRPRHAAMGNDLQHSRRQRAGQTSS